MKSIVIFTRTLDPNGYPFNDDYHWNAYQDLLLELKAKGAQAYFASGMENYVSEGVFRKAYTVDRKQPVKDFTLVENVKADIVFEKGGFTASDVMVLNPPFVHNITADKIETYKHFSEYQPRTVVCEKRSDLERMVMEMPGEMVVVKEAQSNGGRAVLIGTKTEVLRQLPDALPLAVQEFMDTSVGIPGYVEGVHDVRVKIGGGEIFGGMIRTPAPGELRANLAQGGQVRHLMPDELPPEAINLAKEIDCYFKRYPRYYAIDFACTANGWKLIELNSKPGLSPISVSPQAAHIIHKLAEYLIDLSPSTGTELS